MEVNSGLNTHSAPSGPSPLWIIALFIALSEVMAGVAAIGTDGGTRIAFATFAVAFPLIVLAVFIWLLLHHPANLYSPGQFTAETSVEMYVQALRRERRDETQLVREAVATAVAEIASEHSGSQAARHDRLASLFDQVLRDGTVTIERSALLPGAGPIEFPVTPRTEVAELLASVYFTINTQVEPFSYGKSWVLQGRDGHALRELGSEWARSRGLVRDSRSIVEAGISPGSTLSVVPPPR